MAFTRENIDRAIVVALYNLDSRRREGKGKSDKEFSPIPVHLIGLAAGRQDRTHYETRYNLFDLPPADFSLMCEKLAASCDVFQKETIRNILKDILKQSEERKKNPVPLPAYLFSLSKNDWWGETILGLCEAFDVPVTIAA